MSVMNRICFVRRLVTKLMSGQRLSVATSTQLRMRTCHRSRRPESQRTECTASPSSGDAWRSLDFRVDRAMLRSLTSASRWDRRSHVSVIDWTISTVRCDFQHTQPLART